MKTCNRCGQVRSIDMFPTNKGAADGHKNQCRDCVSLRAKEWWKRNIQNPSWRLSRRYNSRLKGRLRRAMGYKAAKQDQVEYMKARREKHPEIFLAYAKVQWAVRSGKLVRLPCEQCGSTNTNAHHDNYKKPLDVRWFCVPCHHAHHAAMREAELIRQIEPVYYFRTTIPVREEHA